MFWLELLGLILVGWLVTSGIFALILFEWADRDPTLDSAVGMD